jgi:V/A-type H+-transporting ATPase subunit K
MYWLIGVMTLLIIGIIVTGLIMELHPAQDLRRWFKPTLGAQLMLFVAAHVSLLLLGVQEAMANPAVAETGNEISIGMALAFIGIGIPTAFSTLAAAYAVGAIGAASLAVLAERPEVFGRTLIYLGLAEGIAIYGLVISILLLDKL